MNKSETRRRAIVIGASSGIAGGTRKVVGAQVHELRLTYASGTPRPSKQPAPTNGRDIEKLLPFLDKLAATMPWRWKAAKLLASESGPFIIGATHDVTGGMRIDG
ncbi:MAG TPA: hypothetical protein VFX35_03090 [Solirubrobacterales bacterium]|nr:hypothetical protein [Solirubrobacterales bacterium]